MVGLKFFLYVLSFVCCFPMRRLTACVGKACVPSWFLILEMKSYECELSFALCCMLEDTPPWNTATFDSRTGFAKMDIGNFTPTRSHPDLLFTGHILQNWGLLGLLRSLNVPASQGTYTPLGKKLLWRLFSHQKYMWSHYHSILRKWKINTYLWN